MFSQLTTPPGHVKERIYPNLVGQDGDVQRYGGLKATKKDETIFAAYDKAEMRKAKIMIVANSEFAYTSKSLFWPDVIMLAAVDLDLLQSVSLAIRVQKQTDKKPNYDRVCWHQRPSTQKRFSEHTQRSYNGRECCVASDKRYP